MGTTKAKNGEIEFLRFIFAVSVMIFHFNGVFPMGIFKWGNMGVDFFFVVTGALMAMSAKKVFIEFNQIPNQTYTFLKRKVAGFFPGYLVTLILQMVFLRVLFQQQTLWEVLRNAFNAIPRVLMLEHAGVRLTTNLTLATDWYLSAMVLASLILYPILLCNYEWMSKLVFPILGLFGLGALFITYGNITAFDQYLFSALDTSLVRAVSEIALGVWIYEMSLKIGSCNLTMLSKVCLTALKWLSFGVFMIFVYAGNKAQDTFVVFLFCMLGVALSFSGNTFNIPYNKVTGFLGKYSLYIYLTHNVIRRYLYLIWEKDVERWKVAIAIVCCFILAGVVMILTNYLIKLINRSKKYFVQED